MRVTAPASSANLGPGFDAIGLALELPFVFVTGEDPHDGLLPCDGHHPASVAYTAAGGGAGDHWWRSRIPPGRGLGFSGAARVAGALAGALDSGLDEPAARSRALEVACELEGHPDNAAASLHGGLVVTAAGHAIGVPVPAELSVVVWWPDTETSTERSRAALPTTVSMEDAVFSAGRAALLVAALATGDLDALDDATRDRLHTASRLTSSPATADALERMRGAGALATWLSGSGPTAAAFVDASRADRVQASLASSGTSRSLAIDRRGAVVGLPAQS